MKLESTIPFLVRRFFIGLAASLLPLTPLLAAEPFDYFQNSWNVIALKDYNDGTRITPENELLVAHNVRLRLACGPSLAPLGREPIKTLHDGWLPVIRLATERGGVRYEFMLWATPLPSVTNWQAAYDWPTEGENFLNWIEVRATNRSATQAVARMQLDRVVTNTSTLGRWSQELAPNQSATHCFRAPFAPLPQASAYDTEDAKLWLYRTVAYWRGVLAQGAQIDVPCQKSVQTLKAAHVCQLIANDHGELHAGEGFYDEFYIRDGGYQLLELEEAGLWDPARKAVATFLLGNVHGWLPDDDGAGDWGAVAEYVIHYADGQTQSVPLISHRTADDWATPPDATEIAVGLKGDPWHLNVLGVRLRAAAVEKIVFRDLGTPAAPVLVAVTLEQ